VICSSSVCPSEVLPGSALERPDQFARRSSSPTNRSRNHGRAVTSPSRTWVRNEASIGAFKDAGHGVWNAMT
jgi:hypothetical protein